MKQVGILQVIMTMENVAVVMYHALGVLERNAKVRRGKGNFSGCLVKQNGAWLRVMHAERRINEEVASAQ